VLVLVLVLFSIVDEIPHQWRSALRERAHRESVGSRFIQSGIAQLEDQIAEVRVGGMAIP
jgi:hypothetical protein